MSCSTTYSDVLRLWQGQLLLGLVQGKLVLKRTGCGRRDRR